MKLKKLYLAILTILPCLLVFLSINPVQAAVNHNDLISDGVFDNYNSMSAAQINTFLNSFPDSCISSNHGFTAPDVTGYNPTNGFLYGSGTTAGKIIYDAAQAYQINPEVLLATLQKEQSLVTGTAGCSKLGYVAAVGYDCPDGGSGYNYSGLNLYSLHGTKVTSVSGTCVDDHLSVGFSQQLIHAAWLLKFDRERAEGNVTWAIISGSWNNNDDLSTCYEGYMTEGTFQRCPSGSSTFYDGSATIDSTSVEMDNGATAALYDYTPHLSGNNNFVNIFSEWFGSTSYKYAADITNQQIYSNSGRTDLLSSMPTMTAGQTLYFTITATNTGSETWEQSFTNLATANPDNRVSAFANNTWGATNRPAKLMQSSVAPGGTGAFEFSMTAPNTDGTYSESFGLVADGQADGWMQDSSTFNYTIDVSNAYNASLSSVNTYSDPSYKEVIPSNVSGTYEGQTIYIVLKAKNTGTDTWEQSFTNLATANPDNRVSAFANNTWGATNRPAKLMQSSVAPGGTGAFEFSMTAPVTPGTYNETFQLVADGQADGWMPGTVFSRTLTVLAQPASVLHTGRLSTNHSIASNNGLYTLIMQTNGNLALYSQGYEIWSTGTNGKSVASTVMQGDGNLVLYEKNGKAVWASNTAKKGTSSLDLQSDGNLVLYNSAGHATWASGTNGKW